MPKKTQAVDSIESSTIKEFELSAKKYKLVDFERKFTIKQMSIAKEIVADMLTAIFKAAPSVENAEVQNLGSIPIGEMLQAVTSSDLLLRMLALIYLEESEEIFNGEKYKQRLIDFESLEYDEGLEKAIIDFFTLKLQYIMESFQTSFQLIAALNK